MENLNAEQIRYKMSEKQIKTALVCLSKPNSSPADREKCYFMWKEPSCLSCYHEVAQNALALITSQEQRTKELAEESKKWEQAYDCMDSACRELSDKCDSLTEENERLKSVEFTCGFIKPHKVLECPIFDEVARTKADTVRKMQEKLKRYYDRNDSYLGYSIAFNIDRVANEMLEGINDEAK